MISNVGNDLFHKNRLLICFEKADLFIINLLPIFLKKQYIYSILHENPDLENN